MSRVAVRAPGVGIVVMSPSGTSIARTRARPLVRRAVVAGTLALVVLLTSLLAGIAADHGLLPRAFAPRTAAAAPCVNGWRELDLPADAFSRSLFSVVNYDRKPRWLLGGSHRSGTLILRKRKGEWTRVKTGESGTRGFTSGSAVSGTRAMAVGYDNPRNGKIRPLGGRVTSSGFGRTAVPGAGGHGASLTGVVALSTRKAWAVGTRWVKGRSRATAYRWNGRSWSRREPATGSSESALTAIDAPPRGGVWAVGWKELKRGEFRPLIKKRTGKGWKTVDTAFVPKGTALLTDVYFAGRKKGWISGYVIRRGTTAYEPFLQRWDGSSWNKVDLPWAKDDSMIVRAVTSDGKGVLWMAGVRLPKANAEGRGFVAKRVNGDWSLQELDVPSSVPSDLRDIQATQDGALAVGAVGSTSFGMETCGTQAATSDKRIAVSAIGQRIAAGIVEDDEVEPMPQLTDFGAAGAATSPAALGHPVRSSRVRFVDRAQAVGIAERTKTWSGVVADVDKDGWKDIWFSRHLVRPPRMLMGGPNGFTRAPAQPWTIGDRHGCDAADIDKDGAKEIFCAFGGARGTGVGRHELSMRVGEGDAEVRRNAKGAFDPFGRGREAVFVNLDKDGFPDLFVTNDPERVDGLPSTNRFFKNRNGTFVPAPWLGLDHSTGARCVWSGDIDRDRDGDILHCQSRPNDGKPAGVRFYRNEKGRLRDRTGARGIRPMGDIAVAVAELTGDRRKDLVQLSQKRIRVSEQTSRGFRRIFEATLSDGVGLALGDVDKDGRADIYVLRGGKGNKPDRLLIGRNRGRRWQNVRIPITRDGDADAVLAIDHDRNGRTDFLVLNGKSSFGPVQLISAYRR